MTPENKLKVQFILIIIGIGLLFGLVYNFLFYPHTFVEYAEAGSISILIGLFIGLLEEFVLYRLFQHVSFLLVTIIRSILYSLLISTVLCLVLSIETSFVNNIPYFEAVRSYLESPLFERDFFFTFSFIITILFILQVILLIGRANFFRLILGIYHRPKEVCRIFMFVDLKGSTGIAEKLPNKLYSGLIRDFFYDVSDAILLFGGEIYQYVGDEIVIIWPARQGNVQCIRSFFKMQEIIARKKDIYQSRYGLVPEFKAGIHVGNVIMTSVGKQKKEIVYHGDVLNTASRIEGKCNELRETLLISEDLRQMISPEDDFQVKRKDEIELKGKNRALGLYGVRPAPSPQIE